MSDQTMWGIHAGRNDVADSLFLNKKLVALGWAEVGDLSKLKADREAYKKKLAQVYLDKKPGWFPVAAGQIYRFVHEMKVGDIVVYPSKADRNIHIGEVVGDYQYKPDLDLPFPQTRAVKWLKAIPRTSFSQGALYETGSAMSFFQIKNYADEFFEALLGKTKEAVIDKDETVSLVTSDIEDQTRDFVLKQLAKNLKGLPLEDFVVHLLEQMGYHARLMRAGEPSVDIIAHKDDLGFEPPIIKVQVKSSDGKIGDRDVSALYGKVDQAEYGLLVALGQFTPPAITFANSKSNLRLIDGSELVDLIFEYYENFDTRYKSILPLKKIYVPEAIDD